jgi:hypothetical protein
MILFNLLWSLRYSKKYWIQNMQRARISDCCDGGMQNSKANSQKPSQITARHKVGSCFNSIIFQFKLMSEEAALFVEWISSYFDFIS